MLKMVLISLMQCLSNLGFFFCSPQIKKNPFKETKKKKYYQVRLTYTNRYITRTIKDNHDHKDQTFFVKVCIYPCWFHTWAWDCYGIWSPLSYLSACSFSYIWVDCSDTLSMAPYWPFSVFPNGLWDADWVNIWFGWEAGLHWDTDAVNTVIFLLKGFLLAAKKRRSSINQSFSKLL